MRIAVQIPIKWRSSIRVPNKNFRELAGKPLCCWLLDRLARDCPRDWDIFIDSEDERTFAFIRKIYGERFRFFMREAWYASDQANGNHLIANFAQTHRDYDLYVQTYITAVTLTGRVVREAVAEFVRRAEAYDSLAIGTLENGWVWFNGEPVNYDHRIPEGLPRSQDAQYFKESTGLYMISKEALGETGCRLGKHPLLFPVEKKFTFDIDTMDDFLEAQTLLKNEDPDS